MRSICAIEGVEAAGVKEGKYGLAIIRASGTAAATFTSNLVSAAPVNLMRERIAAGRLEAIVVNSGCANAYTGKKGYEDAVEMSRIAAGALGIEADRIGIASTGVIGRYLDLDRIGRQCKEVVPLLEHSAAAETAAARAIMTTDLVEKHALIEADGFSVGGICKGSGMIAPNMGTMIGLIYTDAEVGAADLQASLRLAVRRSFNRVVVDGDESTNDCTFCTATGAAGRVPQAEFAAALQACCASLAQQIAADGEGATKMLEVRVSGASDEEAAEAVARTIVGSPLVKTAIYGEDPNWGRVIAAAGRAGVRFDPDTVSLTIGEGEAETPLVRDGVIVSDLVRAKAAMHGRKVVFTLAIGEGEGSATAWGCDLTEKYVEINGKYTT
ncbi:bifunctional glutamate N-acetyltransferase/amino-acid acetyltransferase ArgJ [Methanofollis tationis]|uniref:Glutamate N-acetyltransferase n=1 Tax=Methanofollis tationis TaxID=81417 RepID=A0A7K4HPS1_9EURY|nr:bifunctional glutamate N-acetyltransferase/amino-acid acetyltransferase ArgJ [Methanofollis tationis]NVO67067.1 bifunctional glutamate N-acetyltransferase/amino-acid acetyltransferase ArgJ [Methanofollis tationis]